MLVFWEQRLVFLATPKTGSTAIAAALESLAAVSIQRPPALKHTNARRFHRFVAPYLRTASQDEDWTVVALMREPRDWLGSWYRYRMREGQRALEKSTRDLTFEAFVQAWCTSPQPEFANVGSQAQFLRTGPHGGLDRLFRYEDIGSLVTFLEDCLDCEIVLPRLNVSPEGETELSDETDALLHRVAAEDFALYRSLCDGSWRGSTA